jgi:hypothetical protein
MSEGLTGAFGHPYARLIRDWFDPSGYLLDNADVSSSFPASQAAEAAEFHFLNTGFRERRIYCPQLLRGFDRHYYRTQLSEPSSNLATYELFGHWLYDGIFQGLAGNEVTDQALDTDVHVFGMGRVASYSIVAALERRGFSHLVHAHSGYEFIQFFPGCCLTYRQLVSVKALETFRPPITFLSGVRDPFAWFLSTVERSLQAGEVPCALTPEGLADHCRERVGHALNWFDHEYFQGVDVFAHPFDAERGAALLQKGRTQVILYRVDKLESVSRDIARWLGLSSLEIPWTNAAPGATVHAGFRVSDELWDAVSRSAYMRHFFSDAERAAMASRWTRR